MWTAKIISARTVDARFEVNVSFQKGEKIYTRLFTASSLDEEKWIDKQIVRVLESLNKFDVLEEDLSVKIDQEYVPDISPKTTIDIDREAYREKLEIFNKYVSAISRGIVTVEHQAFIDLHTWLKINFRDEYIGLFGI